INATVCFTVPQALAVAEAVERGLNRRRADGLDVEALHPVCTIMMGRLDDWMRVLADRDDIAIDPTALNWAGIAAFKHAYALYRERGYRARLLAAAYRHRLHWTELVGGDVILTMTHQWQVRFNESGVEPRSRIDVPIDPAIVAELSERIPDFRRAYEADGMRPTDFDSYGAPARGDDLRTRVELDALRPVHVRVAEQRRLPAAEAVVRDRDGDRHVHADHADVRLELELACRATVAGEDRCPIAVRVVVDERDRFGVGRHADDLEDRAEDLVPVAVHVGAHAVEQRDAEEEAVALPVERMVPAVDDEVGALVAARVEVRGDLVAMLAGDERAHLRGRVAARPDPDLGEPAPDRLDERVGHAADGDDDRDRHAPLAGRAVRGADCRVGRHPDVRVGQDDHVVLRPAQRLDALAVTGSGLVDVARDRRRADERDRRD